MDRRAAVSRSAKGSRQVDHAQHAMPAMISYESSGGALAALGARMDPYQASVRALLMSLGLATGLTASGCKSNEDEVPCGNAGCFAQCGCVSPDASHPDTSLPHVDSGSYDADASEEDADDAADGGDAAGDDASDGDAGDAHDGDGDAGDAHDGDVDATADGA